MSDVYSVTPEDVSAEMPGLFPVGFTPATKPSTATVTGWITDADTYIDTVVEQVAAVNIDLRDPAARLARRYILADVGARVYRAAYAGRATPQDITALAASLGSDAILKQIQGLATSEIAAQMAALEEAQLTPPRIAIAPSGLPTRSLLIDDDDLDAGPLFTPGDPGAEQSAGRRGRF